MQVMHFIGAYVIYIIHENIYIRELLYPLPQQQQLTNLSKWLKAATTVSLTNPNEADTVANQLTTSPRMSRNSVGRKREGGIYKYHGLIYIAS